MTETILKIVLLGSFSSGKTSLIQSYVNKYFDAYQQPTIGVMFNNLELPQIDSKFSIHLWDTAGHERFNSIIPLYYHNTNIIIIVFDTTSPQYLQELTKWYGMIENNKALVIIVGTKTDLITKRQLDIIKTSVSSWASTRSINSISYLSSKNIEEVSGFFEDTVTNCIVDNYIIDNQNSFRKNISKPIILDICHKYVDKSCCF